MFFQITCAFWLLAATVAAASLIAQLLRRGEDVTEQEQVQDFDDDYFVFPPWGMMGQPLIEVDDESFQATGWQIALSTDGQTLAQAYPTVSKSGVLLGFKVLSYVYVQQLVSWMPFGDTLFIETPEYHENGLCGLDMTNAHLALSYFFADDPTNPLVDLNGAVHVWGKSVAGRIGGSFQWFWRELGVPIVNKDPVNSGEMFGASVAIASLDVGDSSELRVAVGTTVYNPQTPGRVEVYTLNSDSPVDPDPWELVGKPIIGDTNNFGFSVKLSKDGRVLAVLGSSTFDDSDDGDNMTCLIRVFKFSDKSNDWIQLGQDITSDGETDKLACVNLALSADGTTLVSGGRLRSDKNTLIGHVRVWSFSGRTQTWERKGVDLDTLVPHVGVGQFFGFSTAISDDGNRVLVSSTEGKNVLSSMAIGSIYTFDWNDGKWEQVGTALTTNGVALSIDMANDGKSLAYGSPFGLSGTGYVAAFRRGQDDDELSEPVEE